MVDDNCELIVEVGDNRCWPCKSNRGNPPLDTTDQLPSDIISAIETMIKIKAKTKIMTKIKFKLKTKAKLIRLWTQLTNYPPTSSQQQRQR